MATNQNGKESLNSIQNDIQQLILKKEKLKIEQPLIEESIKSIAHKIADMKQNCTLLSSEMHVVNKKIMAADVERNVQRKHFIMKQQQILASRDKINHILELEGEFKMKQKDDKECMDQTNSKKLETFKDDFLQKYLAKEREMASVQESKKQKVEYALVTKNRSEARVRLIQTNLRKTRANLESAKQMLETYRDQLSELYDSD